MLTGVLRRQITRWKRARKPASFIRRQIQHIRLYRYSRPNAGISLEASVDAFLRNLFLLLLNALLLQGGQKKGSKSIFFIKTEIIVCWTQSLDQSSMYLMSKRGPKYISIAFRIFDEQTRMWDMVEIAVNRLIKSSCFMFSCWPAPNSHKDCYDYASMSVHSSAVLFYTPSK